MELKGSHQQPEPTRAVSQEAKELGVNLDQVEGLGPGRRIALENLESPARALRKSSQYGDLPSFSFNLGEKRPFEPPAPTFPFK
jgi:pyruvate/2-oxoglutarate dehydrogenase complex dihydrolipoamide acyltransferase (E2) component